MCVVSHVRLFVTPWTVAYQAPLSLRFSRQEYWSELLFPPPLDLPDQRLNTHLLHWQVDSLPLSHQKFFKTYNNIRFQRYKSFFIPSPRYNQPPFNFFFHYRSIFHCLS